VTNGPSRTPENPAAESGPARLLFTKSSRLLKRSEFLKVYELGTRVASRSFVAFCLDAKSVDGPKIGFTASRALGKSNVRNRIKRRVRETLRRVLPRIGPQWRIVMNLRRAALDMPQASLDGEVERLVQRCAP
jgi:ribonuclease P protein component